MDLEEMFLYSKNFVRTLTIYQKYFIYVIYKLAAQMKTMYQLYPGKISGRRKKTGYFGGPTE